MTPYDWNLHVAINDATAIRLNRGEDARRELHAMFETAAPVYCWLYLVTTEFTEKYFDLHLSKSDLWLITDYRTRTKVAELMDRWPNIRARSWSANRTMHDKTFFTLDPPRTIITTNNGTLGSWTLSKNRCITIESHDLAQNLHHEFLETWRECRPIIPKNNRSMSAV